MNWKKTTAIATFIATLLSIMISGATIYNLLPKQIIGIFNRNLPIGTIVPSMLEYSDFKKIVDGLWVPADGDDVPRNSKYYEITKQRKLPDLRGAFLRGLNEFENGNSIDLNKGDPDSNREAGSYQADATLKRELVINKQYTAEGTTGQDWSLSYGGVHSKHALRFSTGEGIETRPKNIAVYYYIKIN